jgi:hypothetical protein
LLARLGRGRAKQGRAREGRAGARGEGALRRRTSVLGRSLRLARLARGIASVSAPRAPPFRVVAVRHAVPALGSRNISRTASATRRCVAIRARDVSAISTALRLQGRVGGARRTSKDGRSKTRAAHSPNRRSERRVRPSRAAFFAGPGRTASSAATGCGASGPIRSMASVEAGRADTDREARRPPARPPR